MHPRIKSMLDGLLPDTLCLSNFGALLFIATFTVIVGALTQNMMVARFGAGMFVITIIICLCIPQKWRRSLHEEKQEISSE